MEEKNLTLRRKKKVSVEKLNYLNKSLFIVIGIFELRKLMNIILEEPIITIAQ